MKHLKLSILFLAISSFAFAQTPYNMQWGTYSQSFDGLANSGSGHTTFPSGWGINELGTGSNANGEYRAGTGSSNSGDTYSFGASNSTDRSLGGLASGSVQPEFGFAFTNSTGTTITQVDIALTMEQWRGGSATMDSCLFSYSTNATSLGDTSATWTQFSILDLYEAAAAASGAIDGNLAANQMTMNGSITVSIPINGTMYYKWRDINASGSDDGLSIDDVSMTLYDASGPIPPAPAAAPMILSMSPMDDDMNVSYQLGTMSFTFDDSIGTVGPGNVFIRDINNSANDVTLTASSFTWSADGKTWTYSSLALNPATAYAINIDSNVFSNGQFFPGIYNNTDWNFTTIATPTPVTMLNETFTGCMDPVFGVFKAYSENGNEKWRCTTFGHNDSNAVRMNGYSGGAPRDNVDWLISPPLDLSAMNNPQLNFWSKLRFPDNNLKELYVSTNYAGIGNPTTATWQQIQISNWSALDTTWQKFTGIDFTQYKSNTFHFAFKYTSDTTAADEWSLDDIEIIEGPNSVSTFTAQELDVKVLGDVYNQLNLLASSSQNRELQYTIRDMAGKVVLTGEFNIKKGSQSKSINVSNYASGLYVLELSGEHAKSAIKFIKR